MICMGLFRTFSQGRSSLIFCLVMVRKRRLLKILHSFHFDQLGLLGGGGGGGGILTFKMGPFQPSAVCADVG